MWRQWEERFRMWEEYQIIKEIMVAIAAMVDTIAYTYSDPTSEFKRKYEECCDILGVPYNADNIK